MGTPENERMTTTSEDLKQLNYNTNNFEPETKENPIDKDSLVFVFIGKELLLIDGKIPLYKSIQKARIDVESLKYIGRIHHRKCFALEILPGNEIISLGALVGLRQLYALLPDPQLRATIYGFQIVLWNRKTKYCGGCGSLTEENLPDVTVKSCPDCKEDYYPKISPSVIVAVINGDKILLAQHKRVTNGMYTVLAGFVNPGESLEECIHREIKEESGIEVTNIRYFGSQAWPFPDSLMIGFIADYANGELKPDNDEITDLKWFKASEIPEWPDKVSIARSLIDYFIDNNINE
jgi:NAD+ diphosphatase